MINLLDTTSQKELRAARLNVTLITYCAIVIVAVICVALLAAFSYWWLNNKTTIAEQQITKNESRTNIYADVRAQAAVYSANLGKLQTITQNRSSYAVALLNIVSAFPSSGVTLTSVTLSPSFISTPLKLTAVASDYAAVLTLREQLAKSPYFSDVKLDNASCGGTSPATGQAATGCQVSVTATLSQQVLLAPGATP